LFVSFFLSNDLHLFIYSLIHSCIHFLSFIFIFFFHLFFCSFCFQFIYLIYLSSCTYLRDVFIVYIDIPALLDLSV
jgi:hypothetical protein